MDPALSRLRKALARPLDTGSLTVFRAMFGGAVVVLVLRFFIHGWIGADYVVPRHFFHYWGFGWIQPWPGWGMYAHYAVMGIAAACVAFGVVYRPACVVLAATSTYAHFSDKSNYLNHYYLVSLLAALAVLIPVGRTSAPAWILYLFRFQVGVVYVFGGLAKIGADWLLHGEPLRIWLAANIELPIVGRFFDRPSVAIAFSWCGMLFDLTIVGFLLLKRTRRAAYFVVVGFHLMTSLLFHIGMFPWLMMISATLFWDPAWPMRLLKRARVPETTRVKPPLAALALYCLFQLVLPLRHFVYPGNTLWTEEGFRFSWRVMLIEKSGELEYTVVDREGHRITVTPRQYLTPFQARMTSTQPDMILELAHIVAADFDARGRGPVQVFADARVSFNGRMNAPMIDSTVDLAREEDTLAPKRWILPAPTSEPQF